MSLDLDLAHLKVLERRADRQWRRFRILATAWYAFIATSAAIVIVQNRLPLAWHVIPAAAISNLSSLCVGSALGFAIAGIWSLRRP